MTDLHQEKAPIQAGLRKLSTLLGKEEQAIVLIVDQDQRLLSYRVQSLADVIADLAVHGLTDEATKSA